MEQSFKNYVFSNHHPMPNLYHHLMYYSHLNLLPTSLPPTLTFNTTTPLHYPYPLSLNHHPTTLPPLLPTLITTIPPPYSSLKLHHPPFSPHHPSPLTPLSSLGLGRQKHNSSRQLQSILLKPCTTIPVHLQALLGGRCL